MFIVSLTLFFSIGTTIKQKKFFLTRHLMMYTRTVMPLIITGDFNIDVLKQENAEFIDFMLKYLRLNLASDATQATTFGGSCIDLTFTRNVQAECKRYCSYFSYHRPILSILKI